MKPEEAPGEIYAIAINAAIKALQDQAPGKRIQVRLCCPSCGKLLDDTKICENCDQTKRGRLI